MDEGYRVAVVDNLSTGKKENLNPKAKFYNVDIRDGEKIRRIFEEVKPDYVNHHAAQIDVRKSIDEPGFDALTNIIGSINLIEAARKTGVKKFIYISTGGAIYGEPDALPADEDTPVRPISAYGVSKHAVEHYLHLYLHNYKLDYTVLRYANVYGPRQDPRGEAGVIAIFTDRMMNGESPVIFGTGEQTRDYVYVGDAVEANIRALTGGSGGIFNIGTGVETSVNTIFSLLSGLMGFKGEMVRSDARKGEVERIFLDCARAAGELGWKPSHGLKEGLRKTVEYYKKFPAGKK